MRLVLGFVLVAVLAQSFAAGAQPEREGEDDSTDSPRWSFTVTPYLWAAGLDGNTAASGAASEIDTGYRFLSLENLDLTLAVDLEAHKERWAVLVDGRGSTSYSAYVTSR